MFPSSNRDLAHTQARTRTPFASRTPHAARSTPHTLRLMLHASREAHRRTHTRPYSSTASNTGPPSPPPRGCVVGSARGSLPCLPRRCRWACCGAPVIVAPIPIPTPSFASRVPQAASRKIRLPCACASVWPVAVARVYCLLELCVIRRADRRACAVSMCVLCATRERIWTAILHWSLVTGRWLLGYEMLRMPMLCSSLARWGCGRMW